MEEGLVLEDWAAERTAKLVLTKPRQHGNRRTKLVGVGIKLVVAEELIQRAVEAVRAALGDDVDHRSGRPTRVRRKGIGHDANFLDGIDTGPHPDSRDHTLIVVQAIDHLVVQRLGLAVHGHRRTGPAIVRAGAAVDAIRSCFCSSRRNLDQADEVAAIQG